jgi:hypothetical protein
MVGSWLYNQRSNSTDSNGVEWLRRYWQLRVLLWKSEAGNALSDQLALEKVEALALEGDSLRLDGACV